MTANRHLMFYLIKINHSLFIINIQKLMIEVYKSVNKPCPDNYFDSLFTSKRRQDPLQNDLLVPSVKTVTKGKDSAKYLGVVTRIYTLQVNHTFH